MRAAPNPPVPAGATWEAWERAAVADDCEEDKVDGRDSGEVEEEN